MRMFKEYHSYGTYYFNERNELHREDGPAVEFADGEKQWCINGKLHRTDGPAREWEDGRKEWWTKGELNRIDGPAIEGSDGQKSWWLNGQEFNRRITKLYKILYG